MSDTPRTEIAHQYRIQQDGFIDRGVVSKAFAEDLERELTAANEKLRAIVKPATSALLAKMAKPQDEAIEDMRANLRVLDKMRSERDSARQRVAKLRETLQSILEIGKRDMSNPKYDGYFDEARAALAETEETK